ncbi:MAG: hypothetical protein KKC37_16960 [Proteobacteria bacterium]|nr:hypothetical protein [Pseudomonadota bacterium]
MRKGDEVSFNSIFCEESVLPVGTCIFPDDEVPDEIYQLGQKITFADIERPDKWRRKSGTILQNELVNLAGDEREGEKLSIERAKAIVFEGACFRAEDGIFDRRRLYHEAMMILLTCNDLDSFEGPDLNNKLSGVRAMAGNAASLAMRGRALALDRRVVKSWHEDPWSALKTSVSTGLYKGLSGHWGR